MGLVARASASWGAPRKSSTSGHGVVAGWGVPQGATAAAGPQWLLEGCDVGQASVELSAAGLTALEGDHALLGLSEQGLVASAGRAGGHRGLYVTWPSDGAVLASTHLSTLLEALPEAPAVDVRYLGASLFRYGPQVADRTPYVGIRRLPMAEAWVAMPKGRIERWSTYRPVLDVELSDEADLPFRLSSTIRDVVRRHIRGARRSAVEVSGGLDSSMILAVAVGLARDGLVPELPWAFTYESSAPWWQDDRPYLRSLEDHLGIRIHRVLPGHVSSSATDLLVVDGMPAPSTVLSVAKSIAPLAAREGVDVVITGNGGDPVLDGNPRLFGELVLQGRIREGVTRVLGLRGGALTYQPALERLARFILVPLLRPLLPQSGWRALKGWSRSAPPWAGAALTRQLRELPPTPIEHGTLDESPAERYQRLLSAPYYSAWSDLRRQEEDVGGYTRRDPLFDDDLLRFVARLPPLSLMRGGFLRGLMREAMRGLVPEGLRLRESKGTSYFFTEQTIAARGGLDAFGSLSDVRMLADLDLVEPSAFRRFLQGFASRAPTEANYGDVWCVLSAEAFLRAHARRGPARVA
jgi:asparagine synthase (glutamine-hydrolysing)